MECLLEKRTAETMPTPTMHNPTSRRAIHTRQRGRAFKCAREDIGDMGFSAGGSAVRLGVRRHLDW